MAVICWLSIHHASNMFHGCNESKIRDPKDFLVYAWVFSIKPMLIASGPFRGRGRAIFTEPTSASVFLLLGPVSLQSFFPMTALQTPQLTVSSKAAGGPLLGTLKTTGGQSGKGPLRQKMSSLTSLPPSLDSLLSVHLSITHPFHSLICSFIQQMKWTCTICHVFD